LPTRRFALLALLQTTFMATVLVGPASEAQTEGAQTERATAGPVQPNYRDFSFLFNSIKRDRGYNSLAGAAVARFEAESGLAVRQRAAPLPEDSVRAIRDLADRGVGNILLLGFSHLQALEQLAGIYPQVRFTLIDAAFDAPNVRSILFREDQVGFLVGVAAALATKTGRLGFIGAVPIPPVERFGCGFVQGARSQRADIQIVIRYLLPEGDGFREGARARVVAQELLDSGVDILFPAAGIAGQSALLAASEAGMMGIGVDSNQNADYPGHLLTSAVKRVDEAIIRTLRDAYSDRWTAGTITLGLAEGGVDWARDQYNEVLIAPYAGAVDTARRQLLDGTLTLQPPDQVPACRPG
jgi:basic membrane protein A and related proteins